MSTGSQTPPGHRPVDLSQEDGGSGQSSVDISTAPAIDDKERLSLLQSTVQWIKEELVLLRDKDRQILQQLLKAHSTVCEIREQQKNVISAHQGLDNRKSVDYLSNIEKIKQAESFADAKKKTAVRMKLSYSVSPPPISLEPQKPKADNSDDDILRRFLGEDTVGKFFSQSNSQNETDFEEPVLKELGPPVKTLAELKAEAKRDGRSSVAFEMQMLRQKLQEEARKELAAFDREFDSPAVSQLVKEENDKKYRHSILNRMDEILNPVPQRYNRDAGHHIRQSSEPAMVYESTHHNGIQSSASEDAPGITRQARLNSQHFVSHSFRLPTQKHFDLSRPGSESEKHSTHYNTSVVKRRRPRPDSGSSIDSNGRHPLRYSVESLNRSDQELAANGVGSFADYDLDKPEIKLVSPAHLGTTKHKSHSRSRSLQQNELSNYGKKPVNPVPQLSEGSEPDIYPETSAELANSKPFTETKKSIFGRSLSRKKSDKDKTWL